MKKPPGHTRPVQSDGAVPRLPHERDESSDSQKSGVRPIIKQAHDDLVSGQVDTDRGPPADRAYQQQKKKGTPS